MLMYLMMIPMALSSGGSSASLSKVLSSATEMLTWLITSMGSLLSFIFDNPVILVSFLISLGGAVVGVLMRIWHSA